MWNNISSNQLFSNIIYEKRYFHEIFDKKVWQFFAISTAYHSTKSHQNQRWFYDFTENFVNSKRFLRTSTWPFYEIFRFIIFRLQKGKPVKQRELSPNFYSTVGPRSGCLWGPISCTLSSLSSLADNPASWEANFYFRAGMFFSWSW